MMFSKAVFFFTTALASVAAQNASIDFFFFGNFGDNVNASVAKDGIGFEQQTIANVMQTEAAKRHPAFFAVLGDNFYQNGVNSTTDPLWTKYYTSIYTGANTFVPWYPILGNRDYYSNNSQAELDYYSDKLDNRWTFPDYQYTKTWTFGPNKTLEIVFINTESLCPNAYSGAGRIDWPTDPIQQQFIWQPTLQWISNALAASTADVLLVAGHYHVYANGVNRTNATESVCLQTHLVPLLQQNRVAAYINAHVNAQEHYFVDGVNYITSGKASSVIDYLFPETQTGCLYNSTVGGFGIFHVTASQLNFTIVDLNGNYVYNATISNTRDQASRRKLLRGKKA